MSAIGQFPLEGVMHYGFIQNGNSQAAFERTVGKVGLRKAKADP